jgi:hypothetical protein|tara:strand:- start:646 stop:873 length:228 start_codon:yes stop_codon:yes gene_type:complete
MIAMDRETLMMIATIVAIAGVIFLFKEMNKQKQDLEGLKNFSSTLIQRMRVPEAPMVTEDEPEVECEAAEEKKEE